MNNIISFEKTTDLHNSLMKTIGEDDNFNKLTFKNSIDNWEYKNTGSRIVEEQQRGVIIWETSFTASSDSYIYGTILVTHKDRYIKTKDKMIIKDIERVEIY
jgi:hypothetical protein